MFKKIRIEFYKTRGGGSKAVYKLYKKNRDFGTGWHPLVVKGMVMMMMMNVATVMLEEVGAIAQTLGLLNLSINPSNPIH